MAGLTHAQHAPEAQDAQDAHDTPRGVLPVDRLFLGYILLNTAVLAAHGRGVVDWPPLLAANALAALLPALLARARRSRLIDFIGGAYALILAPAFYTQLGLMAGEVGVLHDAVIQRLEQALFGGQASLTWHVRMPNPVLSWILHLCYLGYYGFMAGPPLFLFLRRPARAFERGAFLIALGLYVSYAVFALFPVAGPRYVWGNATGSAAAVLPARALRRLLEGGSALGTAFPSSHVAASWCAVYALWREAPRAALLLAPLALGLALGTVYGQFHYVVDVVAGAVLAAGCCALQGPLSRAWAGAPPPSR